ncbi:ABC transporter permease [Apibacter sp. B3889]|uniref:ABC transporter permease n=1 Tax=unclassified Apibacter TaxID=2630820 RepID=UPI0013289905|nr:MULTISPECIES: ABC transporter permease [unclassified Apibacter]MXO34042.1 ABC transporter permease [Apibacter sp. B3883]MXO41827.1 ABC transporter permease [Apibacter sp. B3889]MXP03397.1 ABC transporter permease [Apibacter sp. B3887]MXP07340.1 ABC transporter permease [Apibacter sp. B3935]
MFKDVVEYISVIGKTFVKEIRLIFSDAAVKSSYLISPIIVGFLYSYIYSNEIVTKIPIAVVDQDQSQMTHTITRMVNSSQQVKIDHSATSLLEAENLFNLGKVKGIILLPKDFTRKLQKGEVPSISVYCDASYMLYYKQFLTSVTASIGTYSAQIEVNKLMAGGTPQKQAVASRRPIDTVSVPLFNIDSGYATFVMPVVFLIAIQTLQISAMGVLGGTQRERKSYTKLYPFIKKPLGTIPVLLGRSGAYLLISMILMVIQVGLVMGLFKFPQRGNPFEVFVFLIPFLFSVTFLGIFLMNFFKKREDAIMIVTIFSIPSLFLCGVSWPTLAFPEWIKVISYIFPTTLAVKGFLEITQSGASLIEIKELWFQMWIMCLIYFVIAALTLKRLAYVNLSK